MDNDVRRNTWHVRRNILLSSISWEPIQIVQFGCSSKGTMISCSISSPRDSSDQSLWSSINRTSIGHFSLIVTRKHCQTSIWSPQISPTLGKKSNEQMICENNCSKHIQSGSSENCVVSWRYTDSKKSELNRLLLRS